MIRKKYGDMCSLRPPLEKERYDEARSVLPAELFELLKLCDGIDELMVLPNANDGKPFVSDCILYSFDEILATTKDFADIYGEDGIVFSGNGAGGCYVIMPDGTVYLYEFPGEDGDFCAPCLTEYFAGL